MTTKPSSKAVADTPPTHTPRTGKVVILWFRQDFRLADNRALTAAIATGLPVLPIVIIDPDQAAWPIGGASRWWLNQALKALTARLEAKGSRLILLRGNPVAVLPKFAQGNGAAEICITRVYEPAAAARDRAISESLEQSGIPLRRFGGGLLLEPEALKTKTGDPYKVYTPFWRALLAAGGPRPPTPEPKNWPSPKTWPQSEAIDTLVPLPTKPDWAAGLRTTWRPGEKGALARLDTFLDTAAATYDVDRNRPDKPGTSRLSPHLHFGEISAATCWHRAIAHREAHSGTADVGVETFLKELAWREFSHHLLTYWPTLPETSFKPEFEKFPWRRLDASGRKMLKAWQKGATGYPIVDAGMRELWHTGWMHNRVRMIVASFLIKHLLIHWREGEAWFWDTLVDADLAANAASWQWVAGSGADAAPYFRIFNPISQGEKFDPDAIYIRQWVPELARLPTAHIFAPWEAPPMILAASGISLGRTYPMPIVDHSQAREAALSGFATLKAARAQA